ncbi:MAG: NAD-dependent epimerase/dehydratase family protein [Acidobacteriota bacterium]|nr:NAD-dependent epimerase/dehydratase family protein [Acidobacteriota bacterium]
MKNIIVTGSDGFIGKNLILALRRLEGINVYSYDINDDISSLKEAVRRADIIFHLAGVNRPEKTEEYETGNVGFTRMLISMVEESKVKPLIIFSSSIQATLDNPYGLSKRRAEEELIDWAKRNESAVVIYRLPNVFGKWCRPNYNSAVATFCHNIARDLEVHIIDSERVVELVYIDDVVKAFLDNIKDKLENGVYYNNVTPVFKVTVKKLVEIIKGFKNTRSDLTIPDFSDPFIKRLYATYLSYLPQDKFSYQPEIKVDNRGILAELLKSQASGQIFVSRTKPGITRGNHFHDTKVEKFCVLDGQAIIRFRDVRGKDVIEYKVSGETITIVDIPPGYTHSIENIGQKELIVLFWANEIFDPENPDTYRLEVKHEQT